MRRTAEEILARHFPGMTVEQVDQALSDVPAAAPPAPAAAVAYFSEHGGPEAAERPRSSGASQNVDSLSHYA